MSQRLTLSRLGQWIPSARSTLNLSPLSRLCPSPAPARDDKFETLATTPVSPSFQAPQPSLGTREGVPKAGGVEVKVEAGPATQPSKTFYGIEIPLKPVAPAEGECCQSGCAHCTYDIYLEDLTLYHERLESARREVLEKTGGKAVDSDAWPAEFGPRRVAKVTGAKEEAKRELEESVSRLDPSMRAFLAMEAKLKAKQSLNKVP